MLLVAVDWLCYYIDSVCIDCFSDDENQDRKVFDRIDEKYKSIRLSVQPARPVRRPDFFLRFSSKIFPDCWPQATLNPARAASNFRPISSLSLLFAIPKIDYIAKTAKTAKTMRKHHCPITIFSDFPPRFSQISGRRPPHPLAAGQAPLIGRRPHLKTVRRPPTPSPREKKICIEQNNLYLCRAGNASRFLQGAR